MQSRHGQAWAGSGMSITNLAVRWHAMCCWMRMQSTRSTTPVRHLSHLDAPPPSPPHHTISLPSLSLTMPHNTTAPKKVSAPPWSRASTHAMAARGDGVVCVGRGCNNREEKRKHNISLTHTCTTCCLCVQVWHVGGGGHGLLVVVRNTSNGAAAAAAAAFPLCTGTCIGVGLGFVCVCVCV